MVRAGERSVCELPGNCAPSVRGVIYVHGGRKGMIAGPWSDEGIPMPAATDVQPFPAGFRTQDIQTNGTTLYVRVGGHGPAVILLHGYGETGDMWASLAADLARDHTIVAPDLRGMG